MDNICRLNKQEQTTQFQSQRPVEFAIFRSHLETFGKSKSPDYPRRGEESLGGLLELVETAPQWRTELADGGMDFDGPKDGPAISAGRSVRGETGCDLLIIDIDGKDAELSADSRDQLLDSLPAAPVIWYETWHSRVSECRQSCCVASSQPRDRHGGYLSLRLIFPLARRVGTDEYGVLYRHFVAVEGWDFAVDFSAASPKQLQYLLRDEHPDADGATAERYGLMNEDSSYLDPDHYLSEEAANRWARAVIASDVTTAPQAPDYVPHDGMVAPACELPEYEDRTYFKHGTEWPTIEWLRWLLGRLHPDFPGGQWVKIVAAIHHTGANSPKITLEEAKELARKWSQFELMAPINRPSAYGAGMGKWNEAHFEAVWNWCDADKEGGATWRTIGAWADIKRTRPQVDGVQADRCAVFSPEFQFTTRTEVDLARGLAFELFADEGRLIYDWGKYWSYDEKTGVWQQLDEEQLNAMVSRWDGMWPAGSVKPLKISSNKCKGAVGLLKSVAVDEDGDVLVAQEVFDEAPTGVVDGNGIFWRMEDGQLTSEPVGPEHFQQFAVDVEVDPNDPPPAPMFEQFLADIFSPFDEQKTELATFVLEWLGIALVGLSTTSKFAKVPFLYGAGNNGKSTLIKIIEACFSGSKLVAIPPQDYADKNCAAELIGARLNVVPDVTDTAMLDTNNFKSAVTGERIKCEAKFEQPVFVCPNVACLFATNELATVKDNTHGFWRRISVVPFRWTVPPEKNDEGLADRIIENELGGIISMALVAAEKVVERGGYTTPTCVEQATRTWFVDSNPIAQFAEEALDTDDRLQTPMEGAELYNEYRRWAEHFGYRPVSKTKFGRRIKKVLGDDKWTRSDGTKYFVALKELGADWRRGRL